LGFAAVAQGEEEGKDEKSKGAKADAKKDDSVVESKSAWGLGFAAGAKGGKEEIEQQAKAGRLASSDVIKNRPDWFKEDSIPQSVSGESFYDPHALWIGACLSSFGICYNVDSLERLGVREIPASWADLTDPVFYRQVALADPTKSGSAAKAFEMVIQQQMQELK
jgi:ABC-type Fe3+ transport system substrate-binding protein